MSLRLSTRKPAVQGRPFESPPRALARVGPVTTVEGHPRTVPSTVRSQPQYASVGCRLLPHRGAWAVVHSRSRVLWAASPKAPLVPPPSLWPKTNRSPPTGKNQSQSLSSLALPLPVSHEFLSARSVEPCSVCREFRPHDIKSKAAKKGRGFEVGRRGHS